jgi:hypothetical protein
MFCGQFKALTPGARRLAKQGLDQGSGKGVTNAYATAVELRAERHAVLLRDRHGLHPAQRCRVLCE